MKAVFAALTVAALSTQAIAYDRNQSIGEERQQRHQTDMHRFEEAAKQREAEHSNRMRELDRQQSMQEREKERQQRQIESEQLRLWLWSR